MSWQDRPPETGFDLRARAELALAYEPGDPPAGLLRHAPWHARPLLRLALAVLLAGGLGMGGVLALRPPELVRPCEIDGRRAYHLTTFFEKGGLVTVISFDQPQQIAEGEGWWASTYWRVVRSQAGRPLVLIAEKKQALAVASRAFGAVAGGRSS